jgi:hypothetical protein
VSKDLRKGNSEVAQQPSALAFLLTGVEEIGEGNGEGEDGGAGGEE